MMLLPTRRTAIRSMLGASLLPAIASELLAAEDRGATDPLAPKKPHFTPKAKRVIWLFSTGGVSQMDTFDPKPKLIAADGKTLGAGGGLSNEKRPLVKPRWAFKPGGKCGTEVSDLYAHREIVVKLHGRPPADVNRLSHEVGTALRAGSNQLRLPRGPGQGWIVTLQRLVDLLPAV